MITAKIIADSKNQFGDRLTTFVLTFPRIVLAEFNTHRMVSKNSASSRAIPFKKMAKMVEENPFIPIRWQKDHSGMQGTEYFPEGLGNINSIGSEQLKQLWLIASKKAVESARLLHSQGVTKQICNRLLEPFMWHTVIATATDWQNFFVLRANEQAEIHIQDLAYKMLDAYNNSIPKKLKSGQWHIPFGDKIDEQKLHDLIADRYAYDNSPPTPANVVTQYKIKIAVARCARVSYLNFEGKDDYEADVKLYDRLATSGHFSPFEHCAEAMNEDRYELIPRSGNFKGFIQLRKTLQCENKFDNRVIKK